MDDTIIYVILIAMLGVMGIFIGIAANRKSKGFKIVVLRDFRNPNKKKTTFWAMYDSRKDEYIKLYSSIFKPTKSGMLPPADLSGYSFDRVIYAVQGPTGNAYDDNIVFIHLPLIGLPSANEYSISMSEAIQKTIRIREFIEKHNFKINDVIEYNNSMYTIKDINFNGVVLSFNKIITTKDHGVEKQTNQEETILVKDLDKIETFKLMESPITSYAPTLINYFNTNWVMQNMGIVPIEDVNLMLSVNKNAIASFNSKLHDRAMSKMGLWARYPWMIPMVILIFVVVISASILWYSISQDVSGVGNTATAAIQQIVGIANKSTIAHP